MCTKEDLRSAAEQFNVYSIEWTPNHIIWSLNGNLTIQQILDQTLSKEEFHNPFFFLINLAVGGIGLDHQTMKLFPANMYVDYVRVYQDVSKVDDLVYKDFNSPKSIESLPK